MSTLPPTTTPASSDVTYPESDGRPMADNTVHARWIKLFWDNLGRVVDDFVAADLLWYPVKGDNKTRVAPDVLVALGRPKGDRGSYRTWDEDGVPVTIVVEVRSPSNSWPELMRKLGFYQTHGVSEYWVIDPDAATAHAFVRGDDDSLDLIGSEDGFTSPLLGIEVRKDGDTLSAWHADGTPFTDMHQEFERAEREKERANAEKERANAEEGRANAEKERADRLAAKLAALGIDLDDA